jgi:dihydroceramide fatty acyl 2-hydroxylase
MDRTDELRASPPMFESALLDRFTRVHPVVPVLIYAPVILALFLVGAERVELASALGLVLGGYAIWTLTEYWLHRVVFHFEPDNDFGRRMHFMIHGVHHDHPNDRLRLVMPPSASIPLAALFLALFWAVLPAGGWQAFGAGFLAGYLAYDMLHYHVHHHVPRTAWGKRLRELHMRHHFQDHERMFGVSAPWWDYVFGTAPKSGRPPA